MQDKILKSLDILGYTGEIKAPSVFNQSIESGPKDVEYTKLVNYITNELKSLCSVDEEVNAISAPEDSVSFLMELSSFLKELGCPHESFVQGHMSDRLNTPEERLLLLDYLISELMAARMIQDTKPDKKIELKLQESPQALNLKKMLITLRFPKPPANISIPTLFEKLIPNVETAVAKGGKDLVANPIFNKNLNDKQWHTLQNVQEDLHDEYLIRREMILKRLDCTIQSFQWSDKMKERDEQISNAYMEKRKALKVEPDVTLADLLSAREDLAIVEKTSSASVRKNTQSSVNKVIIGQVPDRGGRTSEQAPPPPEMPSWQQRQAGPSGGGRGGRGGGGRGRGDYSGNRGGGYNKNNYNQNQNYDNRGQNYDNRGGQNYDNRGQKYDNRGQNYDNRGQNNRGQYNQNQYQSNQSYDAAGSYTNNYNRGGGGGHYQDDYRNEPKRPKTYDNFQNNRTTYADQYVNESQHNQQYRRGGGRGGSGNYNRRGGGGGGGYQNYY